MGRGLLSIMSLSEGLALLPTDGGFSAGGNICDIGGGLRLESKAAANDVVCRRFFRAVDALGGGTICGKLGIAGVAPDRLRAAGNIQKI